MQMMMNTMLGVLWSGDTRYTPDTAAGQWRVITNSNLSLGLQLSAPAQPGPHSNLSNKLCVLAAGRSWQAPTSLWLHANWSWGCLLGCGGQQLHAGYSRYTGHGLLTICSAAQLYVYCYCKYYCIAKNAKQKSRSQYTAAATLDISLQTEWWRH